MASEIKGSLRRKVRVYGVPAPVNVIFTEHGIEMSVERTKTKISGSWQDVVKSLRVPGNAPSFLFGEPLKFLCWQAGKQDKRGQRREAGAVHASSY
jgi:hypothetical protein